MNRAPVPKYIKKLQYYMAAIAHLLLSDPKGREIMSPYDTL